MLDEEHGLLTLHRPGGETTLLYLSPDLQVGNSTVLNFSVDDIDAVVEGIARGFGPDIAWFKDPAGHTLSVLKEL